MADPCIVVERAAGLATLTLNRPASRNVLDMAMALALRTEVEALAADPAVRAVVVQGAGAHFMVGGDVRWFHELLLLPPDSRRAALRTMIDAVHAAIAAIRGMDKPVLAAVRGAAAGFGLSLVAACDLVLADETAFFSVAYSGLGASPDGGASFSLPRLLGPKVSMALACFNERLDAAAAQQLGLVNQVLPVAQFDGVVADWASRLASGPTAALARTKRLFNQSFENSLAGQLRAEEEAFLALAGSVDFSEGVQAFSDKRRPVFVGR